MVSGVFSTTKEKCDSILYLSFKTNNHLVSLPVIASDANFRSHVQCLYVALLNIFVFSGEYAVFHLDAQQSLW